MSIIKCYYIDYNSQFEIDEVESLLERKAIAYLDATCYEKEFIIKNLTLDGIETDYEGK